MKKTSLIFLAVSYQLLAISLSLSAQTSDPVVLMTIGGRPVSLAEFKSMYYNNLPKDSLKDPKSLDNYLKLFIDFKLKVNAAIDTRLDTTEGFKQEMNEYRQKLADPKMRDTNVENQLIKEAYERSKWDIKASHILIKLGADATSSDTLTAYKKILDIRTRIEKGQITFEAAAKEYSDDTYSKDKGGDLGYFTGLGMVYPFENAAYNSKVGEITMPVRTQYGYHLLKVTDKRPDVGQVEVAHIMLRKTPKMSPADSIKTAMKADSIYQLAKAGQDFSELAKKYSQDQSSARRGGILPWFGVGRMSRFPAFETASFSLKNPGDIAPPVQTEFGWHIIKLIAKKPVEPFDSVKDAIATRVMKDTRSEKSVDAMIAETKQHYHFMEYPAAKKAFYAWVDSSFYKGKWSADKVAGHTDPLFTLDGASYTQEDFAKFLAKNQMSGTPKGGEYAVNTLYPKFVKEKCLDYKDKHLEMEDRKFAEMLDQYKEGILLFDITDQLVWTKALKDTTGLKSFYQTVKFNYMWTERCDASVYTCSNKEVAKSVRKLVKDGKTDKEILAEINGKKAGDTVLVDSRKFEKKDNSLVDANWKQGMSEDKEMNSRVIFVNVRGIVPPQPKDLNDVRGMVTTDYQNYLMDQWLKDLRAKYPVVIKQKSLAMVMPHQ